MTDIEIELDKLKKRQDIIFTLLSLSIEYELKLIKDASLCIPVINSKSKDLEKYIDLYQHLQEKYLKLGK